MAYTRIHAIKATVDRSIAYICNPDKTDGELFVSSYGCSARTAALEFAFANGKTTGNDGNLAHHLIQSFAPGEVSFEEAHQIGTELADWLLKGNTHMCLRPTLKKTMCTTTLFSVPRTTSAIANTIPADAIITGSGHSVMSYAPNTICPSLYRDSAVESSTRNGRLPTAEPHGKTCSGKILML